MLSPAQLMLILGELHFTARKLHDITVEERRKTQVRSAAVTDQPCSCTPTPSGPPGSCTP
jgi:hypothetical protein